MISNKCKIYFYLLYKVKDQYDTRYLTQLSPQLDQQVQSVTGRIN